LIVDHLSWRWLFIVGAVAVAGALVLVHRFVPESPVKTPSRVDVPGAALLSGGLVALLVALTEGETWGWLSGRVVGLFGAAAVLLVVWGWFETRAPEPLVDMRMLARRPVLLTNLTALIAGFALFGTFVLIPTSSRRRGVCRRGFAGLVHYGFHASATKAGLYLLPSSVTLLFAGPLADLIGRRVGMKWPLAAGMLLVAASAASLALWHAHPWQILAPMPFLGVGVGFAFATMATLIADAVRPTETGVATGMNTVLRTVGGVVGGQMGAALLSAYTIDGTGVSSATGFELAFGIGAGFGVVGAALALFVTGKWSKVRRRVIATAGL
jgi:MFS family permease